MLPLDEVASRELVEHEPVRVRADGDAAHPDAAVGEHAVAMEDGVDGLPRQAQDTGAVILEVEDAAAEGERRMPAAAPALAGVDVEVLDLGAGGGPRRRNREREGGEEKDEDRGGGARHAPADS